MYFSHNLTNTLCFNLILYACLCENKFNQKIVGAQKISLLELNMYKFVTILIDIEKDANTECATSNIFLIGAVFGEIFNLIDI